MNWISRFWQKWVIGSWQTYVDSQQKLILLVCLPCIAITFVALLLAQVSGYLIAFIIIVMALLCSYVFVASKQNSEYQVRTLSNLIESMIDGDYTLRGRLKTNQAFQELLTLINQLSETLARHKIEAKESRLLLERIMEQMDAMVIATDDAGLVVMANASAKKLIFPEQATGAVSLTATPVGAQLHAAPSGLIEFTQQLKGEHLLVKERFLSEGKPHTLYLLTSAERLLMEKERKAWQSLLRVLSHEMNNSLTPIATISQSIQKKLAGAKEQLKPESLLEGVNIINERAESLSEFIASYSKLSHLPEPNKSEFSLQAMVRSIAALYPDCEITFIQKQDLLIYADKRQFEQVLINLFKNGVEAMAGQAEKNISVSTKRSEQWQQILIEDTGCGIANLDNVFVPFYTTKAQGSGIGLALCRQILFNHGGMIAIENRQQNSGVKVTLSLPFSGH